MNKKGLTTLQMARLLALTVIPLGFSAGLKIAVLQDPQYINWLITAIAMDGIAFGSAMITYFVYGVKDL